MLYLGLDVHSKWLTVVGFDQTTGESVQLPRVMNDPAAIAAAFAPLPAPRCGAMESGTNALAMHRRLQPYFDTLIMVAPTQVWDRRRDPRAKTDARDAATLAMELARGHLHPLYLPDDTLRGYRALARGRIETAQAITRQVNHLYALLRGWGASVEKKLLTKGGGAWLATVTLPDHAMLVLEQQLARLTTLQQHEAALDTQIAALVRDEPICQRLMTIPCVGPLTALVLRAEIGDITRFATGDKLIGYAGLDPRVLQSGDHCRYGGLTKAGNAYLRYIAVLFAQHVIRSRQDTPFKRRFYRLCHAHHPNEIKSMLARDFLTVVHSMWRTRTVWQYPRPAARSVA